MTIKNLARDLYWLQQEVERLENDLKEASLDRRADIEAQLRKVRSEKDYLRRALDGQIGR